MNRLLYRSVRQCFIFQLIAHEQRSDQLNREQFQCQLSLVNRNLINWRRHRERYHVVFHAFHNPWISEVNVAERRQS